MRLRHLRRKQPWLSVWRSIMWGNNSARAAFSLSAVSHLAPKTFSKCQSCCSDQTWLSLGCGHTRRSLSLSVWREGESEKTIYERGKAQKDEDEEAWGCRKQKTGRTGGGGGGEESLSSSVLCDLASSSQTVDYSSNLRPCQSQPGSILCC